MGPVTHDGLNSSQIEITRPRRALTDLPPPTAADGRLVLAVDVSGMAALGRADQRAAAVLPCPRPSTQHGPEFALDRPTTWPLTPEPGHTTTTNTNPLPAGHRRPLGPAPSPADPPHLLARPPRRPPDHRRDPHPPTDRPPARRPRSQARLAVVVGHRRHRHQHRPRLAGVPAPLRPGARLPTVQTDPRLDPPEDPHPAGHRPLDLADHHRPHPAPPRPTTRPRPTQPWEQPAPSGRLTPARIRRGFRNLRAIISCPPAHRNPPDPAPDALPAPTTADPRPTATSEKSPDGT